MGFKFLHAADLHLGSPFTGLALKDEAVARRFAAASRDAFSDLVTTAIDAGVAFVVIAGDVYDGEWKDTSIGLFFNREVARLERSGIPFRSEEHTSELQSQSNLVCRLLLEKKKKITHRDRLMTAQ